MQKINAHAVMVLLAQQGERGWSVARLAREIGRTRGSLHNLLTGRRPASSVIVDEMAQALGVPKAKLLQKQ